MLTRLAAVSFVALVSLSPPLEQNPQEEIAALKRQVQELREQQQRMEQELTAIKNFLQSLLQGARQGQGGEPEVPGLVGAYIPTAGEPALGSPSARVTVMEISDYQCPFCRRQTQQTFPQLQAEYINTGKVQFVFVDYPIAQLHPTAARSHEAAACAGDQGKFWQMHQSLFRNPIAKDDDALLGQAKQIGADLEQFRACLSSGRHVPSIRESVQRMEQLGIQGTPMTVIGLTPAPGQPLKVVSYIYGARPYEDFKRAIEAALTQ